MAEFRQYVTDVVHEATQTEGPGFDLTVAAVYEITDPGRIDFGGGELEAATTAVHETHTRNPGDDYEWWTLREGQYLIEYNESLRGEDPVVVQTRDALLRRGAFHPTVRVTAFDSMPLRVSPGGLELKENARVSTVRRAEP